MVEYTYKDIIIDPTSEEAKNCIGKDVYFADNPSTCLRIANNSCNNYCRILRGIEIGKNFPFVLENRGIGVACIIPKKEEPKKYIPFSNKEEFLSSYKEHTKDMKKYGLWIFEKIGRHDDDVPRMITEIWPDGVIIGSDQDTTSWEKLLKEFVFEDYFPCGKLEK